MTIVSKMGFSLQENESAPEHPALFCVGAADGSGRGWAWHDNRRRQRCFSSAVGDLAAPAPLVASAINATTIDGMLALAQLAQEMPGIIVRVFPRACVACGGNHYKRAAQIRASVKLIHKGAIAALRTAEVPEYLLRCPYRCDEKTQAMAEELTDPKARDRLVTAPETKKTARRIVRTCRNLPVWAGNSERTRLAQIAFAHQYRLKKGI